MDSHFLDYFHLTRLIYYGQIGSVYSVLSAACSNWQLAERWLIIYIPQVRLLHNIDMTVVQDCQEGVRHGMWLVVAITIVSVIR